MSDSNEYPRLLYKAPGEHEIWGRKLAILEVADADAEAAALAEGWAVSPNDAEEPAAGPAATSEFSLLDEKVSVIVEHLPALTDDELADLLAAEKRGKTRKGVIEALEGAIDSRKAPPSADPPAAPPE